MPRDLQPGPPTGRPAAIDYFYTDNAAYTTAAAAYSAWLNQRKIAPETDTTTTFEAGETQVRFIYLRKTPSASREKRTVVYWQIKGDTHASISNVYSKLLKYGYTSVQPPKREETVDYEGDSTERCIVEDGAANQYGLIINPPYPRFMFKDRDKNREQPFWGKSPTTLGLLGFGFGFLFSVSIALGLLASWGVSRLVRRFRK